MEYERMEDGYRVFLLPEEIRNILDAAKKGYEGRIRVMIMLMCLSLRIGTASEVKAGDFFQKDGLWWIEVEGKDPTVQYQGTKSRKVWIPDEIKKKIDRYIQEKGLSDDDYLVDIGKRQLSNNIETTTENAATATGNEDYKKVTAHDFRRYFATHMVMRLDQDEEVVRQLGGWKEISHMWEYLLLPTDLVKRRLGEGGLLGSNPIFMQGKGELELVCESIETIDTLAEETEDDEVMAAVKSGIKRLAGKMDGIAVTVTDEDNNADESTSDALGEQSSFEAFDDDYNGYGPVSVTAIAYWRTIGTVVDWTATRANSIWDQHIGINVREWLRGGLVRRVFAFAFFIAMAVLTLAIPMMQMGVYIDPSTGTVHTSQEGILGLISTAAVYVGTSDAMWEKTLADLTGRDRLAELLTLRIGNGLQLD